MRAFAIRFVIAAAVAAGGFAGNRVAAAEPAVPPAVQRRDALAEATRVVRQAVPDAALVPIASKNIHLEDWPIRHPLEGWDFYSATVGQSLVAPIRKFVAVDPEGKTRYPFDAAELDAVLASSRRGAWKDEDFVNAAILRIHLSGVANQDGWKALHKPADFMAIQFNMPKQGPAVAARQKAADQIVAPKVTREEGTTRVTLYAWHLIGGGLRKWEIAFGEKTVANSTELARFGGGGYD